MTTIDRVVSIDAEANGLGGQAFAVAVTLSDASGELEHAVYRCPIEDGPTDPWVAANVLPAIEVIDINCRDYAGMLRNLREQLFPWTEEDTPIIAHVAWPVEARLFLDMYPGKDVWSGPCPLLDVAPVLFAHGHNPMSIDEYLHRNDIDQPYGSPHNPLYDARAAERCFRHLMTNTKESR